MASDGHAPDDVPGDKVTPRRITLSRAKGWRMPPNTVKVDRATKWGNPHRVGECYVPDAAEAVRLFRIGMGADGSEAPCRPNPGSPCGRMLRDIEQLRGKNLACWCKPGEPCHADVLLELANAPHVAPDGDGAAT